MQPVREVERTIVRQINAAVAGSALNGERLEFPFHGAQFFSES